jgi:bifunctional DNA-binding transcriptional regulator/antitoxin component of YhaV-PrlF toxin-antitoxin module
MKLSKVTSGGKVTIPVELRKKYKFTPGRRVRLDTDEEGIIITPLVTPKEIRANAGFLGTKGKLLKSFMEEKKRESEL